MHEVLSPEPLTKRRPSGSSAREVTLPVWCLKVRTTAPSLTLKSCGPVNGMSACNALISAGKNCVYHYAQYTCDQPSCSQGSFDACNSLCLTLDPDYVGPCTNSCHTWCGTAEA